MLRLLAPESHRERLAALLRRWRIEERVLREVLRELQDELERWHRETSRLRLGDAEAPARHLQQCTELQLECDALATELVHVRMAVLGLEEELALADNAPPTGSLRAGTTAALGVAIG